jgi:hypothetical protein
VSAARRLAIRDVIRAGALAAFSLITLSCESGRGPGDARRSQPVEEKAAPRPSSDRPVFVKGPTNGAPVAPFVAREITDAQHGGYNLLVYVGAVWCEPCQQFHAAVEAGEFDAILPRAHLVEFDLDHDKDALSSAGYSSNMIPLFCIPKTDGTASSRRIEGSIKGPDAVGQNLIPRLRAFLAGSG